MGHYTIRTNDDEDQSIKKAQEKAQSQELVGVGLGNESMVTPVFATPILTISGLDV